MKHMLLLVGWLTWGMLWAQSPDSHQMQQSLPDPFRIMANEQGMLKFDLLNLISRWDASGVTGMMYLAYEHKLHPSWSLQGDINTAYFFHSNPFMRPRFRWGEGIIGVSLAPRYYYGMRRRVKEKRSGNNLSANYISLSLSTRIKRIVAGHPPQDRPHYLYSDNFAIALLYGIQRRLLVKGFIDIQVGAKLSYGDPLRTPIANPKMGNTYWQLIPISNFRLGVAF